MNLLTLSPYLVVGLLLLAAAWLVYRGIRRFFRGESGCASCSASNSSNLDTCDAPSWSGCSGCPSAGRCAMARTVKKPGPDTNGEERP